MLRLKRYKSQRL